MKNGLSLLGAAALLLGLSACNDMPGAFGQAPQTSARSKQAAAPAVKPQEPAVQLAEQPAPQANDPERGAGDGSTADAVLKFVTDLETAQQAPTPSPSEAPLAEAAPEEEETAPASNTPQVVRANGALAIPKNASPAGPAQPRVLAVSLIGDTTLEAPVEPTPTIGVHEGMDTAPAEEPLTLDRLIEQARKEIAAAPTSAEKQWQLSLLLLAAGRGTEAAELSSGLPAEARLLTARMVETVSKGSELLSDPHLGREDALHAVNGLRDALRADADLQVPVVALCSRVTTFGVYEPLPAEALAPYRANRVIVYCEIENFTAEPTGEDDFHALLSTRLELLSAEGQSVWVHEEGRIEDVARQKREDFFLAQLVTFPADLQPGEYVLKVAVTDQLAGKTNEGVHRFQLNGLAGATAAVAP